MMTISSEVRSSNQSLASLRVFSLRCQAHGCSFELDGRQLRRRIKMLRYRTRCSLLVKGTRRGSNRIDCLILHLLSCSNFAGSHSSLQTQSQPTIRVVHGPITIDRDVLTGVVSSGCLHNLCARLQMKCMLARHLYQIRWTTLELNFYQISPSLPLLQ